MDGAPLAICAQLCGIWPSAPASLAPLRAAVPHCQETGRLRQICRRCPPRQGRGHRAEGRGLCRPGEHGQVSPKDCIFVSSPAGSDPLIAPPLIERNNHSQKCEWFFSCPHIGSSSGGAVPVAEGTATPSVIRLP